MTQQYSHRNGESAMPTVEGLFWFDGERLNGSPEHGIVDVKFGYGKEMELWLASYSYSLDAHELIGQWWGPVMPPWEE